LREIQLSGKYKHNFDILSEGATNFPTKALETSIEVLLVFLWLARSRASHYVTLKNFVRVVTEIVDLTSETVVAMILILSNIYAAIFTKSQLATLAEILDGIFHLKQTVSYLSQYICVYNLRICHL
jgi:hypothetical protein